jgi:hypothetical protein
LLPFALLSVAGLTFWFALGFPFANHNESYAITAQLSYMTGWEALTGKIFPVANPRPLGQFVAWLGARFADGEPYLVELFNLIGALVAWLLLYRSAASKRFFGTTAFLVSGILFTGYIYLFHLHGVFYSPLLILLAALAWLDSGPYARSNVLLVCAVAFVAAFFHPYAILLWGVAFTGMIVERPARLRTHGIVILPAAVIAALLLVFLVVLQPREPSPPLRAMIEGTITTYRMVELNTGVSLVVLLLTLVTAGTLPAAPRMRVFNLTAAGALGLISWMLGFPLLLLWLGVCLVKSLLRRTWWEAGVLSLAVLLPAPTATGSPTYGIFALFMGAFITAEASGEWEDRFARLGNRWPLAVLGVGMILVILVRTGVTLPGVGKVVRPLLAEKEKTHQMEAICRWVVGSPYRRAHVQFLRRAANPSSTSDAVDRMHRPPTDEHYLAYYLYALRRDSSGTAQEPSDTLVATFGGEECPNSEVLVRFGGDHAGDAILWHPIAATGMEGTRR